MLQFTTIVLYPENGALETGKNFPRFRLLRGEKSKYDITDQNRY